MAVPDVHSLPHPSSGSHLEVDFRRLLLKCYERTSSASSEQTQSWKRDPKFHMFVETLQEQLTELSSNSRLDGQLLGDYRCLVDSLSDSLLSQSTPAYCKKISSTARRKVHFQPGPTMSLIDAETRSSAGEATTSKSSAVPNADDKLKQELEVQEDIQEAITDDLVELASQLKKRTQAVESAVNQRNEILDNVDVALHKSAENATDIKNKAGMQYQKSKIGTCMMCLVLLGVGAVFTYMLIFIKMTRLMGYKAAAVQPPPAPSAQPEAFDESEL